MLTITLTDTATAQLDRLGGRMADLSPVMRRIEREMFAPSIGPAWAKSGLKSRSGELRKAATAWHGKVSAGVTLRTRKGRDLVLAKASTHLQGRKKQAFKKKDFIKVAGHTRMGRPVQPFSRKNPGSPWGRISKRPFFPVESQFAIQLATIKNMIATYIHAETD
jgi:hypothetical protein